MNSGVRYMFLRNADGSPCGCLAITVDDDFVNYGLSTLNPKDDFNRKLARHIAKERLELKPEFFKLVANTSNGINMHIISAAVMKDLTLNRKVPNRARRAAQRWLENNSDSLITAATIH